MNKLTELKPRPVSDWPDLLEQVVTDMNGAPLNIHAMLAHNPDLLNSWWPSRQYLVNGGTLGNRLGELVILRTGCLLQSWYEWAAHVVRSLDCGLSMDEIHRVQLGASAAGWSDQERTLLAAVDQLFYRHQLDTASLEALSAHFSTEQVLDLIGIHSMYRFLGTVLKTWQPSPEKKVLDRLPEGESEAGLLKALNASVEQQVWAVSQLRRSLLVEGRVEAVPALLHKGLRYVHGTGVEHRYDTYVAYLASGGPVYHAIELTEQEISCFGDMARVSGMMRIEFVPAGQAELKVGDSLVTELWKLEQGRWVLLNFQSTALKS